MRIGIDNMIAEVGVRRVLRIATALLASVGAGVVSSAPARAEGCSAITEQVRLEQPDGSRLPDCRAYEQVSPVEKNELDAEGSVGVVQASASGDGVTFFAVAPFPRTIGSAQLPSYLSARFLSPEEWSTQGIEALAPAGAEEYVVGVTKDLSKTIFEVGSSQATSLCEPVLMVCARLGESNAYVRNNETGTFQLLTSGLGQIGHTSVGFADATPGGSRILFETEAKLVPEAEAGANNLYEWNEAKPSTERISLAGVLPGGVVPKQGAFAGPGGPAVGRIPPPDNRWHFYAQNTISKDGSHIFFSDIETGFIYMREPEVKRTLQVSAGKEPAFWRAATSDGNYVFYTEGQEMYRFNVSRFETSAQPEPEALAESREQLTTGAEGVDGVLGISEKDGAYVYFVAPGVLESNSNGEGEQAETGAANLYEWHEGVTIFVTRLPNGEEVDWRGWTNIATEAHGPSGGEKSSRITPDGKEILFSSTARPNNYNNNGFTEFYLYSAKQPLSATNPICISCNPQRTPAVGPARLTNYNEDLTAHVSEHDAFLPHNLSDNGRHVFFEAEETLVLGDANVQTDVYEWEADGEGSCQSDTQNDGCLYLISTGQSPQHSYFGDASANGNDVFFFTRQSLVGQDQDNNADLYDARAGGGILAQNPPPAPVPCPEEVTCRSGLLSSVPSVFGSPSSTTFSGSGNLPSLASVPSGMSGNRVKSASQVRVEKLAKALRVCRSRPKRKRKSCEVSARKRYGKTARSSGKRGR